MRKDKWKRKGSLLLFFLGSRTLGGTFTLAWRRRRRRSYSTRPVLYSVHTHMHTLNRSGEITLSSFLTARMGPQQGNSPTQSYIYCRYESHRNTVPFVLSCKRKSSLSSSFPPPPQKLSELAQFFVITYVFFVQIFDFPLPLPMHSFFSCPDGLLEKLLDAHVLLRVLLHNLGHRHLEVLLGDVDPPLPQGVHAGLGAHALHLGSGGTWQGETRKLSFTTLWEPRYLEKLLWI